jgi:hypothetical protein
VWAKQKMRKAFRAVVVYFRRGKAKVAAKVWRGTSLLVSSVGLLVVCSLDSDCVYLRPSQRDVGPAVSGGAPFGSSSARVTLSTIDASVAIWTCAHCFFADNFKAPQLESLHLSKSHVHRTLVEPIEKKEVCAQVMFSR